MEYVYVEICRKVGVGVEEDHALSESLFSIVFPKKVLIPNDDRTKRYIEEMEKMLGLVQIDHVWSKKLFSVEAKIPLFSNRKQTGYAHVGRSAKQEWIAQVSIDIDNQHFDVIKYIYNRFPDAEQIMQTNVLNQIYAYISSRPVSPFTTVCGDCGHLFHWLDNEGNMEEKWERFKISECGCM